MFYYRPYWILCNSLDTFYSAFITSIIKLVPGVSTLSPIAYKLEWRLRVAVNPIAAPLLHQPVYSCGQVPWYTLGMMVAAMAPVSVGGRFSKLLPLSLWCQVHLRSIAHQMEVLKTLGFKICMSSFTVSLSLLLISCGPPPTGNSPT